MAAARLLKHLAYSRWQLRRAFPSSTLDAIEHEIRQAESRHRGEIRFVVEGSLPGAALWSGQSPRERAVELFSLLRVWDTEANDGVLIYLLMAEHQLEIVADRGIDSRTAPGTWEAISRRMAQSLAGGDHGGAVIEAVRAVAACLEADAGTGPRRNELPDRPVVIWRG